MKRWETQEEQNRRNMERTIQEFTQELEEHPERFAEFLKFSNRFYPYNLKNSVVIYKQNPGALFCQSYEAWNQPNERTPNRIAYPIKRNEKGMKVYIPIQAVILKVDGRLVPLEQATKEEQIRYHAGEIEGTTQSKLTIKTVFDIAQTTCPVEDYAKLIHMGYPAAVYEQVVQGMAESIRKIGHKVTFSKSLKKQDWKFHPDTGQLLVRGELDDTGKLYALAAGFAGSIPAIKGRKEEQPFRETAMQVLLEGHLGLPTQEETKQRLAKQYQELRQFPEIRDMTTEAAVLYVLQGVYQTARQHLPELQQTIGRSLKRGQEPGKEQKKEQTLEKRMTNQELMEEIKRKVQITDYAREAGYTLTRKGSYYSLKEHDSVRIDPDKNCYWQNSIPGKTGIGKGDSVIGFAAEFVHHGNLHEALKELSARVHTSDYRPAPAQAKKKEKPPRPEKPLLPKRAENMRRVYAYLIKSRYLDQDIVQEFVNRKMLYQDINGNCVFVGYDKAGEPNFATLRGTLSEVHFTGDIAGSDYTKGIVFENKTDKLVVSESMIDGMSVMTILKGQGVDPKDYDYFFLNGVGKQEALLSYLKENPKKQILLALDHDLAGVKAMQQLRDALVQELDLKEGQVSFHVPQTKDWNQELTETASRFKPMNEISFLKGMDLPKIHYCAIQSTVQIQETGFRIRNGKDQYRLVELGEDGALIPVTITRQNTMFFRPEEVKEKIPNMYELLPYEDLIKKQEAQYNIGQHGQVLEQQAEVREQQKGQQTEAQEQSQGPSEEPVPEMAPEEQKRPKMEGFTMEDGVCMAEITYAGKKTREAVWKEEETYYVLTGMEVDHTLEKHLLTLKEIEDLEGFLKEHHLEPIVEHNLLLLKEKQLEGKREQFLGKMQEQKFQKNQGIEAAPALGIEI